MGQNNDAEEGQEVALTLEFLLAEAPEEDRALLLRLYNHLPDEDKNYFLAHTFRQYELIDRDSLTEAYNKRKFSRDLPGYTDMVDRGYSRFGRLDTSLTQANDVSLIYGDIDHFKRVNDTYGHNTGDSVLRHFSSVLRKCLRKGEQNLYRIGGEEFAVVVPHTTTDDGRTIAHRLLERVRGDLSSITPEGVTASFGVSNYKGVSHTPDDFIKSADAALYWAKNNGRNQVCVYEAGVTPLMQ